MSNRTDDKSEGKTAQVEAFHWPFPRFNFSENPGNVLSGPGAKKAYEQKVRDGEVRAIRSRRSDLVTGAVSEPQPPRRRGRPPKNARILDQHGSVPVVQPSEATIVQAEPSEATKTLASQNGEQPVKRGRGRPRKIKPLDI